MATKKGIRKYHTESPSDLPKIGAPALRALLSARVTKLAHLTKHTEKGIADLHGMGPKAVGILKRALKTRGLTFKKEK